MGIASRLIISFIAVAVLAAAANLITVEGASIVRTTRFQPVIGVPAAPLTLPVPTPHFPPAPALTALSTPRLVSPDALREAAAAFESATRERATVDTAETQSDFDTALRSIEESSAAYFAAIRGTGGQQAARLSTALNLYTLSGSEIVRLADMRRAAFGDVTARLEALQTRMQAALDGAWKIFGRIVTKQSLLQLNASLDDLHRRVGALGASETYTALDVTALRASEQSFSNLLERKARDFARSSGTEWLEQMRGDHTQLLILQDAVLQLDEQRHESQKHLMDARATLATLLAAKIPSAVPASPSAPVAPPLSPIDSLPNPPEPTLALPGTPPRGAIEIQTIGGPARDSQRLLFAWLTGAVLLLVVAISLRTVRSIVIPVRELLRATEQLARNSKPFAVARGGIKELDTLALAFNRMAEQLTAARAVAHEHQQELEAKIIQRTRELQDLARKDVLTGLPNRRQLFTLLDAALDKAARAQRRVGVLFVDIDNFKTINDSMGHAFGDRVLVRIAERLNETARAFGFAARLGGDEFTIVHEDASGAEAIRAAGLQIVAAFDEPLRIGDRDLHLSISVGISICPDHERDAEALLRAADAALYRAKALGRNQLTMFTPDLLRLAAERFATEQGLRRALERGEFELVFQPELAVESMDVRIVEALIRWRLPDGRLRTPDEFLGVAEDSGLIVGIGDWVLRSAVACAASWYHGSWPQARVAINVSPRQMLDPHFVTKMIGLLDEFNLPGRCIEIELTETVLQTGPSTIATLRRLRDHGLSVALDDFGTGYSSLASLEQLPLNRIKLDRRLIESIDNNRRSAAIARAIIALSRSLNLEVTAEGIERREQFAMLIGEQDIHLQGYLLSMPVPAGHLPDVLAATAQRAGDLLLSSATLQVAARGAAPRPAEGAMAPDSAAGGQA